MRASERVFRRNSATSRGAVGVRSNHSQSNTRFDIHTTRLLYYAVCTLVNVILLDTCDLRDYPQIYTRAPHSKAITTRTI